MSFIPATLVIEADDIIASPILPAWAEEAFDGPVLARYEADANAISLARMSDSPDDFV